MTHITESPRILAIAEAGHPVLTAKSAQVPLVEGEFALKPDDFEKIKSLGADLLATSEHFGLQGLSAPQVFTPLRIFAMTIHPTLLRPETLLVLPVVIINPRIIDESAETNSAIEGCGSLPGIFAKVPRPRSVVAEYNILRGTSAETLIVVKQRFFGFDARVFCHELDHLDGIMFLERVTDWKTLCAGEQGHRLRKEETSAAKPKS